MEEEEPLSAAGRTINCVATVEICVEVPNTTENKTVMVVRSGGRGMWISVSSKSAWST